MATPSTVIFMAPSWFSLLGSNIGGHRERRPCRSRRAACSGGRAPEPLQSGRIAVEQVAIAVADTLHDGGLVVGGAARALVAGILPEPPAARGPGKRYLRRVMVVGDPQAAARKDRIGRDAGAEAQPGIGQRFAIG